MFLYCFCGVPVDIVRCFCSVSVPIIFVVSLQFFCNVSEMFSAVSLHFFTVSMQFLCSSCAVSLQFLCS